jgi:medium-chain acyl-[acyl-carrier-protein] hydrolase
MKFEFFVDILKEYVIISKKFRTIEVRVMYTFPSRVRYTEIGQDGKLTMGSAVNYFQDCSTLQSEDIGVGIEYLKGHGRAWIMSAWQVVARRYPKLGENITVGTWAYGFKGIYGERNFVIQDENGENCIYANSVWVYMDLGTGLPVRIQDADAAVYVKEPKLNMEYAPRKIKVEGEFLPEAEFVVRRYQIDTNHHMNNGQYIKLAEECVPEGMIVRQMRAEYKKSAMYGDKILLKRKIEENRCTMLLSDKENNIFAVVEFTE